MESHILIIAFLSFCLSFFFALGGVGSAVILIPALTWIGVPFNLARPTGLFVNCLSMLGATWSNFREKKLDVKLGLPIIVSSMVMAPVGAWAGHFLPTQTLLFVFIGFLLFSGSMMIFFKSSKYADQYREDRPVAGPSGVGVLAGFVSGLLGVGGGGIISPLMVVQGFNPKKVAMVTAFSVPFSSFSAFITYAAMGSVSVKILVFAGLAAWTGGYLGTRVMQKKMNPQSVKRVLGSVLILIGFKFLWSMA
ncbi:putative permease [Desulforapulum autotrophicum HRM2]|uniref:Probable membrane transporter protein n=1 Tax=Desulforapulum autotrophicum (strain ATCC 43914 / DSM 3382 / VKM B-1955 / HRM2) TaxID=177437 RepID=C0QAD5_DESAH|nr:sulfite exporter TauE/SafE family protein [Desulforapulum autotrophicum]ACN14720.1 putative permease [Desulforapulum autotrophicum HRM2]